jgi:murein hydrolase activator
MIWRTTRFGVAGGFAVALAAAAAAQQAPIVPANTEKTAILDQHQQELAKLRGEQRKANETEAALTREIEALGADRRKLNQDLIETAGRIRTLEGKIAATETRLVPLDQQDARLRQSLEGRRAVIANVLAALQRIGRKPPPALLVRPEDALKAVRGAMLLGAVVPELRSEAQTLAAELGELVRVRNEIAGERQGLDRDLAAMSEEQQRMAALVEERQKRQTEAERALDAERKRAGVLARQAHDLNELIARLEQEAAAPAAPSPSETGPFPPREVPRLGPAVAFASAKGTLRLPVSGVRIRQFGGPDGLGGVQKGLSLATRSGAQVTAPSDAWVVYAGPFRSYGQLLILNAGGGYHVLLAGMDRISVQLGQFVLTGEPVATMGNGPKSAAAVAIGSGQPTLYIEFRKDGSPVDPGPWWAKTDSEKVRG